MRISPKSLSSAGGKTTAKIQARDEVREDDAAEIAESSSPAAIDAGRAQRLIERAEALAERGDMGAAVLATRQSLALAPNNVEAHLLHARLLERNRDFGGARAAYEKAAQLAPERADARDNLARLNTYLEKSQGAAKQFHFDAEELFASSEAESAPETNQNRSQNAGAAAPVLAEPATPQITAPSLEVDSMELFDESILPSLEARLPPSRSATATPVPAVATSAPASPATPSAVTPANDRRKHNIPVATERRRRPVAGVATAGMNTANAATANAATANVATANAATANAATANAVAANAVAANAVAANAATAGSAVALAAPVVAVPATPTAKTAVAAPLSAAPVSANPFDNSAADLGRPSVAARRPLDLDLPATPVIPLWQQVIARPSFYARTLPLVGVALLSLGFLSWARGRAVSQVVAPTSTELASADSATFPEASAPATAPGTTLPLPDTPAQPGAAPGTDAGGFPISNAPAVFQAPPANGAATANNSPTANNASVNSNARANSNNVPSTTTRGTGSSNTRPRRVLPRARPVPNFPGVSLAPAPIPPANVRGTTSNARAPQSSGSNIILPSPSIEMPDAPVPRQRVLPPADNGLNPAGSPNRGYVRITEGRVGNGVIPAQPSAVARENERVANDAARSGQNDQAISQLSQAIRADSDNAGFRYQQRATLFLNRGDYSRAADDFQSAISAYQNQISNGDDVAQARRGLSSARSGLNLALAGKRG